MATLTKSDASGTEIRHAVFLVQDHDIRGFVSSVYEFKLQSGSVDRSSIKRIHEAREGISGDMHFESDEQNFDTILQKTISAAYLRVPGGRNVPVFLTHTEHDDRIWKLVMKYLPRRSRLHDIRPTNIADAATYPHQHSVICDFKWKFEGITIVLIVQGDMCEFWTVCWFEDYDSGKCDVRFPIKMGEWNLAKDGFSGSSSSAFSFKDCWISTFGVDGPPSTSKTRVLIAVPASVLSPIGSDTHSLRDLINAQLDACPSPGNRKYVRAGENPTPERIFHRSREMPTRCAVVLLANAVETSVFVYEWLYQAQSMVVDDEIKLPHHWVNKSVKGDLRLLALDIESTGSDGAAELAHVLHCHLEPLIKHAGRFLTKRAGAVPLKVAFSPGPVEKNLYTAIKTCLGVIQCSKTTKIILEDTERPEDLVDTVTSGVELAVGLFAREVAAAVESGPPPAPKKYVSILIARKNNTPSINIYESFVNPSGQMRPRLVGSAGPTNLADTQSTFSDAVKRLTSLAHKTPLLLLTESGDNDPLLADEIQALCNAQDLTKPHFQIRRFPTYPKEKLERFYSAYSDETTLRDIACRFLTMAARQAIVLDAGSSGTRIFVYRWRGCVGIEGYPILPDDINLPHGWGSAKSEADGGIHGLAPPMTRESQNLVDIKLDTAQKVKDYLAPLFAYAGSYLPKDTATIPVYLLATAGMRGLQESNIWGYKILFAEIRKYLDSLSFDIQECELITGENEGLYGWVAANFLSGTLTHEATTSGFVETGGASAQIAFSVRPAELDYNGSLAKIVVSGKEFYIFSSTWLGLGADSLWESHLKKMSESDAVIVHDPCLPIEYSCKRGDKTIIGTGDFDGCMKEILSLIRPAGIQPGWENKFLMKGAPPIDTTKKFLGSSVFRHATHGIFAAGMDAEENYQLKNFYYEISNLFASNWTEIKAKHPNQKTKHLVIAFFSAALVATTLQYGFGVKWDGEPPSTTGRNRNESVKTNFHSIDATWTLGRTILHAVGSKPEIRTRYGWDTKPQ